MDGARLLRLKAEDADDLAVVSAALQDAVVRVCDIAWSRRRRRVTIHLQRYVRERDCEDCGDRVLSVLALEGVLTMQSRRVRQDAPEAWAQVLALRFDPDAEPPGGALHLELAGGGAVRIAVECIDLVLLDVSEPWKARARPAHPIEEAQGTADASA
jgi:hypothetical protein